MADALCGPSNPLQSLQKQTQADRTLHQDRVGGHRNSPAWSFRTHDPRAGSLDAEFAAFEAGPANPLLLDQPPLPTHNPIQQYQVFGSGPPQAGWAADFQKLHISNNPVPSQQLRAEAPLKPSGWNNEFLRGQYKAKQGGSYPSSNLYHLQTSVGSSTSVTPTYPEQSVAYSSEQIESCQPWHQRHQITVLPVCDEAAFEDAFVQAIQHAEAMTVDESTIQGSIHNPQTQDPSPNQEIMLSATQIPDTSHIRIGSDAIPHSERHNHRPDNDEIDADELARTAAKLLTSVQHDQSEKFKSSTFLALMRQIRDGQVKVQGEDFKVVAQDDHKDLEEPQNHELHPGGRFYPEQLPPAVYPATMSRDIGISNDDFYYQKPSEDNQGAGA